MTQIKTNLRNTRERAGLLRFEPSARIPATNTQKAIEQVSSVISPQTGTGTHNTYNFNELVITSDDIDAGATNPGINFVNGLEVNHTFGGASAKGGRNAIFGWLTLGAPTNAANPYNFNAALLGYAWSGVGVIDATAYMYGVGTTTRVRSGSSIASVIGAEFTVGIEATGAAGIRAGLVLNGLGGDTVKGSTEDTLLILTNQPGSAKFDTGIKIGDPFASGTPPLETTGTIFKALGSQTVLHGIDFSTWTFGGGAFKSPGFSVDGSANVVAKTLALSGSTSGAVTIQTQTGTYNFNLPTTAGTAGQLLTSQGGVATSMTWTALGTGVATWLGTPSSANLAAAVTDETGTGALVFSNTPTLVTPVLGAATGTSLGLTRSFTSGNGLLNIAGTQTQPNSSDTGDSALRLTYTLTAVSATNELITRVMDFGFTNNLTGGGAIATARILDLSTNTSSSTTTTELSHIYLEAGTTSGTVTTGIGLFISSVQGTTKWGILDNSGGNWANAGFIKTGTTVVGSLPAAAAGNRGARHFVTDANATFTAGIGAVVAAGGANNVPVVSDGAAWRIG